MSRYVYQDSAVVPGIIPWNPIYYFIVRRRFREDVSRVEFLKLTVDGPSAYAVYDYCLKNSSEEDLIKYEYFIEDSFGINSLDYCYQAYQKCTVNGLRLK